MRWRVNEYSFLFAQEAFTSFTACRRDLCGGRSDVVDFVEQFLAPREGVYNKPATLREAENVRRFTISGRWKVLFLIRLSNVLQIMDSMKYLSTLKTTLILVAIAVFISSCGGNCDSCDEVNLKSVCPVLTKTCGDTEYTLTACDQGCCVKSAERVGCDDIEAEAAKAGGTTLFLSFTNGAQACNTPTDTDAFIFAN